MRNKTLKKLTNLVIKTYSDNYLLHRTIELLLQEKYVKQLCKKLSLPQTESNFEWLTHVISHFYEKNYLRKNIYYEFNSTECNKWIKQVVNNKIDYEKFTLLINNEIKTIQKSIDVYIPPASYYLNSGLVKKHKSNSRIIDAFIRNVSFSGRVKMLSLNGWRASEYGFNKSCLSTTLNYDTLDKESIPLRYFVNWKIPKTHGELIESREISYSSYLTTNLLNELHNSNTNNLHSNPCLYIPSKLTKKENYEKSANRMTYAVSGMWENYVLNYKPFLKIDSTPKNKRKQLFTERILYAHNKSRDELERVTYFRLRNKKTSPSSHNYRNRLNLPQVIWRFKLKQLEPNIESMFTKYLSPETVKVINDLHSEAEISQSFATEVVNEIMSDCLYPTPHAFRHIWVEAVYRRYDGDIGWMIRSQFKHISPSMWQKYIKNKNDRRIIEQVERRVISTILANHSGASNNNYSGGFNKFLRRINNITKVITIEELDNIADTEIISMQLLPHGNCIIRLRSSHRSNCAIDGVPQEHNASVHFCLDCPNNLTQSGNIPGIILGIGNDLEVLNRLKAPDGFLLRSYKTIKSALGHLIKLEADPSTINQIQLIIKNYKEHVA